nr:sigma factor [Ureibacillus thermosphaericus]
MNDVFLAVSQNSDKFRGSEEELKKWIGTIAKYKAIDIYRKQKKMEVVSHSSTAQFPHGCSKICLAMAFT